MASLDVRTAINAAVTTAAAPMSVYDLSDYLELGDVLAAVDSEAVLIQYGPSDENLASIGGSGNQGWEQSGVVTLHLVVPSGFASAPAVTKGDAIREALRGQRLTSKITVEACEPFTDFGAGSTGLYGAAWKGWSANLFYVRRDCG